MKKNFIYSFLLIGILSGCTFATKLQNNCKVYSTTGNGVTTVCATCADSVANNLFQLKKIKSN